PSEGAVLPSGSSCGPCGIPVAPSRGAALPNGGQTRRTSGRTPPFVRTERKTEGRGRPLARERQISRGRSANSGGPQGGLRRATRCCPNGWISILAVRDPQDVPSRVIHYAAACSGIF